MGHKDFIPRKDADFDSFYFKLVNHVLDNYVKWGHIPAEDIEQLEKEHSDWSSKYKESLPPHSKKVTEEKNNTRKDVERALRVFINRYLRWATPVTDPERKYMGVRNKKTIHTSQPSPTTKP